MTFTDVDSNMASQSITSEAAGQDNKNTTITPAKQTIDTHNLPPITAEDTYNVSASAENPITSPEDPAAPSRRSTLRISLIITALFLSLFVAALDATIVATSVPVICADLNSATGYVWIGASYLIANAVSSPIWAKLSDIWGRKLIMLVALVIFAASSAMCGVARDMKVLIAGRALQGVAGGGLMLLVHIIISDLFSMRLRSLVMGATEGVWAAAGGIGPPLGGIFASFNWRWCFFLNLPISLTAFLLLFFFLDIKHTKTSFTAGMVAMDWWGLLSFLAFSLLFLLGLDFGGVVYAWSSAKVLCLIIIGVAMLGAFLYSEKKLARYPLIPLGLFKDKSNCAALAVAAFHGLAFFPGEYWTPLYLQSAKQRTPIMSGVLLIPLVVATAITGVLAGLIIHRTGRCRELIWMGTAILCAADGSFISLDENTSVGRFIGLTIFFGIGAGSVFEAPLIALQTRSKQEDVATATSTFTFIRTISVAISVIIGGAVFQNEMDKQQPALARAGLPAAVLAKLSGKEAAANVALAGQLPDLLQQQAVKHAFAASLSKMWILYAVLAGLGVVAGAFVGTSKLSSEHVETVTGIKSEKPSLVDAAPAVEMM